jgi:UDP-3-O-[3-hydroxymyristoyl] glucosamine N-acyltransferase
MTSLDEVASAIGAQVVREGFFTSLGFMQHHWPGRLTFVESETAITRLAGASGCRCVLTTPALSAKVPDSLGVAVSDSPRRAFFALHDVLWREGFYGTPVPSVRAATARVHPSASIAESGVTIGENVIIEPHVSIMEGVSVGAGSVIRAGVVLGSEGFQVSLSDGRVERVRHTGGVQLGERVEIQSNCCIDRALFGGWTTIGEEATLDKLVYVAHHVEMGARCRVGAGAAITGSVRIGDDAWIGPNATISDGVSIGRGAMVSLGSVVTRDVPSGARVTGNFAIPHEQFLKVLRQQRGHDEA